MIQRGSKVKIKIIPGLDSGLFHLDHIALWEDGWKPDTILSVEEVYEEDEVLTARWGKEHSQARTLHYMQVELIEQETK